MLEDPGGGGPEQMRQEIRDRAGVEATSFSELIEIARQDPDQFMLLRNHAELSELSSYLSAERVEHRLRVPSMPEPTYPWIGQLFSTTSKRRVGRSQFEKLWQKRVVGSRFDEGLSVDEAWSLLSKYVTDQRDRGRLDVHLLRELLERQRPPDDLVRPWIGRRGPLLGTIHGAKGREANRVTLILSEPEAGRAELSDGTSEEASEEKRVLYVGATRAKHRLSVAVLSRSYQYLESGRAFGYRKKPGTEVVEFGRRLLVISGCVQGCRGNRSDRPQP
jgi:superfamily I DNA/RNA helicase